MSFFRFLSHFGTKKEASPALQSPPHRDSRGLTDPQVTDQDIKCICDFLRAKAQTWWASQKDDTAWCDWYCDEGMGRKIERNGGYLLGKRLLCKVCCDKIIAEIDDVRKSGRTLTEDGLELLISARKFSNRA